MTAQETLEALEALRKGCEAARGKLVTVNADDILSVIEHLEGGKDNKPGVIES